MRLGKETFKRIALGIMMATSVTVSLTGCQYSSLDDYLEALGLKDSKLDNPASTTWDSFVVSDDSLNSHDEAALQTTGSGTSEGENVTQENESDKSSASASTGNDEVSQSASDASAVASEPKKEESKDYGLPTLGNQEDEATKAREALGLTDSNLSVLKATQSGNYAYERLTDAGKTLYVEMLVIMQNLASDIVVSTTSDEAIEQVFDYVMADHPEIFYVDGYHYTNYTLDNVITKISFTGNYTYNKAQVEQKQAQINEAVNRCISNAPSSTDDYFVIKYIYDYLIDNTEYAVDAPDNQNICSVFINGRSVCNGYAKAAQYLLNKLGVECTLVTGTVDTKNSKGVRHAWNLVNCNDSYYYVDVTWGDSSYQTSNGESADATRLPRINYDYLNVTTSDISRNHTITTPIAMPSCTNMADNYYVREDEYFTSAEMALVKDLFDRRYNDGSNNVTIKCADQNVYDSLFAQLITDRKVFDFLQGDTSSVSYTTFADTRTIIFWI